LTVIAFKGASDGFIGLPHFLLGSRKKNVSTIFGLCQNESFVYKNGREGKCLIPETANFDIFYKL
jgi:hypothetical protein